MGKGGDIIEVLKYVWGAEGHESGRYIFAVYISPILGLLISDPEMTSLEPM